MNERKRLRGLGAFGTSLLLAACAPSGANIPRPTGEVLGTSDQNTIEMGWPIDRTIDLRLTGAAHNANVNNKTDMTKPPYDEMVRNRIDIASLTPVSCVDNPNATMDFDTIASRSGTILSEGGKYGQIKIKDNQGYIEVYSHTSDEVFETGKDVSQGDVIATELKCTSNDNDTKEIGLHLDFSVTDSTGVGIDIARVVFVDELGGRTTNTEAPINYNGTMIMPDGQIIVANAAITENNIIPALNGQTAETQPPKTSEQLLDQYLNPELQTDIDKQFVARAIRFWLETYTTKKEPVEFNMGNTLQINTNIEEWIENIPNMLSPELNNNNWGLWTAQAETVFEATCRWVGEDGEETETTFQAKYVKFGALPDTRFSTSQIENGWQRLEAIYADYIWRTKEKGGNWTEWQDFESPYTGLYQYQMKNNEITGPHNPETVIPECE